MSDQQITVIERFYELYANSDRVKAMSEQDWELIQQLQALPDRNEELQAMLSRFLYLARKRQLQIPDAIAA
ncbi:MAG: hypothetical protein ACPGVO_01220 [Spirulinaceae cyanobacterium]